MVLFVHSFSKKQKKKKVDKSKVSRFVKEAGFCLKILTYSAKSTVFPRKRGGKKTKRGEKTIKILVSSFCCLKYELKHTQHKIIPFIVRTTNGII